MEEDYGDQSFLGPNAIKKTQQVIETEVMVFKAGWLDDNNRISWPLNVQEFHPAVYKTGSQWNILMKQCHKKILNLKKIIHLLTENASQEVKKGFLQPLAISLLPTEYFMHNFQIKKKRVS